MSRLHRRPPTEPRDEALAPGPAAPDEGDVAPEPMLLPEGFGEDWAAEGDEDTEGFGEPASELALREAESWDGGEALAESSELAPLALAADEGDALFETGYALPDERAPLPHLEGDDAAGPASDVLPSLEDGDASVAPEGDEEDSTAPLSLASVPAPCSQLLLEGPAPECAVRVGEALWLAGAGLARWAPSQGTRPESRAPGSELVALAAWSNGALVALDTSGSVRGFTAEGELGPELGAAPGLAARTHLPELVALSDGGLLALYEGVLWHSATGARWERHDAPGHVTALALDAATGSLCIACAAPEGSTLWRRESTRWHAHGATRWPVSLLALHGSRVAAAGARGLWLGAGEPSGWQRVHRDPVSALGFSPGGETLWYALYDVRFARALVRGWRAEGAGFECELQRADDEGDGAVEQLVALGDGVLALTPEGARWIRPA